MFMTSFVCILHFVSNLHILTAVLIISFFIYRTLNKFKKVLNQNAVQYISHSIMKVCLQNDAHFQILIKLTCKGPINQVAQA